MRKFFIRNYKNDVVKKLDSLNPEKIGKTELGHDILAVEIINDKEYPWILISGSVHGEEPAGCMYLVDALINKKFENKEYNFCILPCVNPDGYETNTRENFVDIDLNRDFSEEPASVEVKAIQKFLNESLVRFSLSIDLHESGGEILEKTKETEDPPHDFYMWEISDTQKIAGKVIKNLKDKGINTCNWNRIFGDKNNNGAIFYPEDMFSEEYSTAKSFDVYMKNNFADISVTTETCVHDKFELRFEIIDTVVETYLKELTQSKNEIKSEDFNLLPCKDTAIKLGGVITTKNEYREKDLKKLRMGLDKQRKGNFNKESPLEFIKRELGLSLIGLAATLKMSEKSLKKLEGLDLHTLNKYEKGESVSRLYRLIVEFKIKNIKENVFSILRCSLGGDEDPSILYYITDCSERSFEKNKNLLIRNIREGKYND